MIYPIKAIIAEYTLVSIIMTILIPITIHASELDEGINGSNIVFSESGTLDEPTISDSTGSILSESGAILTFQSGSIDPVTTTVENGTGGYNTGNTSTGDIAVVSDSGTISNISSGSGTESNIEDATNLVATGTITDASNLGGTQIIEEKIYEQTIVNHPETEILIQFKGSIDNSVGQYQIDQIESSHDLKTTETIVENNIAVMQSNTPDIIASVVHAETTTYEKSQKEEAIENIINELKNDPRIAHVQKNFIYTTQSTNDTEYMKLWSLNNEGQMVNGVSGEIDADIDYPEAIAYSSGKLGANVIVAVLDTGIAYGHPDLAGHMWNGNNCLSETGSNLGGCIHGYDFANNDNNPNDGHSHGTHVAGTIGALTNNNLGIAGIAPNVTLMAVKILDDKGGGTTATIIRGINFAKHNGARVINASFGGVDQINSKNDFDFLTYDAIKNFPGLFIAAAGNDGKNLETMSGFKNFPSGFGSDTVVSGENPIPGLNNVIAVAANDQNDNLASFSNYGTGTVHIAAPGTNTYSSIPMQNIITGALDPIAYSNNWTKQSLASSGSWEARPNIVVSGESAILSGALWGTIQTPYISGEETYIQKTFSNINGNVGSIGLNIWCDTPSSEIYKDYIEILVNTGGTYQSIRKIDEDIIAFHSQSKTVTIDGHVGHYVRYNIKNGSLGNIQNGSLGIRLRWHSDSIDDTENNIPHYGCTVENLSIDIITETYGYKYSNGTSMATPHVVGAAALAWSYKPNAGIEEVHDAIIFGGDYKNSLSNKIMSGRRLNLVGMLQALEIPNILEKKVTLSGESIAIIDYTSDMETTGIVSYATGANIVLSGSIGIQFATEETGGNRLQHQSILKNLLPDTEYYYKIEMMTISGSHINSEYYTIHTFHTPKLGTTAIINPIVVSGEIYFSGSTATGITFSGSTNSGHIILINTGSTFTADIPTNGLQIIASGAWNGILGAPKLVSTGSTITLSGNTTTAVQQIWSVGNTDSSLTLSGQLATISLSIIAVTGSTADIYRSPGIGVPYTKITTCTITNNTCTFTTDHFSYFAIGNIQGPVVVPPIAPPIIPPVTPPIIVPPVVNPPIAPPVTPSGGNGSITSGPGGGGGGSAQIVTKPQEISSTDTYTINHSKGILSRISLEGRTLNINIRGLQKKLNSKIAGSISRRENIIALQNLYKDQIQLLRSWNQQ